MAEIFIAHDSESGKDVVMITIPLDDYDSLKDDENWRIAFENAGVDNWTGYDYAMQLYREGYDQ